MKSARASRDPSNGGYFPLGFFVDFLRLLHDRQDEIEIITYDSLAWGDDFDAVRAYPDEHGRWKQSLKTGMRDASKIYVLLQHDVDRLPERTVAVLQQEEQLSLPSNVMIFRRRVHRKHLTETGELIYAPYELDYQYFRHLQDEHGFVFGYHSNAFEQALFDETEARQIFENDVRVLDQELNIRYFSPHGGARGPDGRTNNAMEIPDTLRRSIRWVHNSRTVRFDGNYSDGGINSLHRDPEGRDLRDFVRTWQPGGRYRVMTHPQYYHEPCGRSPRLAGTLWYEQVLRTYGARDPGNAWQDVVPWGLC